MQGSPSLPGQLSNVEVVKPTGSGVQQNTDCRRGSMLPQQRGWGQEKTGHAWESGQQRDGIQCQMRGKGQEHVGIWQKRPAVSLQTFIEHLLTSDEE